MARQDLVNLESYFDHRTKLNDMMGEVYHIPGDSVGVTTELWMEQDYVPPAASESDGTPASPFNNLEDVLNVIDPDPDHGCAIMMRAGIYTIVGSFVFPSLVALIGTGGRGQAVLNTSIAIEDTVSQFAKIRFAEDNTLQIGNGGGQFEEQLSFDQCDIFAQAFFYCGELGLSAFVFTDCQIGLNTGARQITCRGRSYFFDSCAFGAAMEVRICPANQVTSNPDHFAKFTNCLFTTPDLILNGEDGKTTNATFIACDFTDPIVLAPALGSVHVVMDLYSYYAALAVGTDFNVTDVTLEVLGQAPFVFNDVIVNASIDDNIIYQEVCTLSATGLFVGALYTVMPNLMWDIPDTTDAFLWQLTGDGPQIQGHIESKDTDDIHTWSIGVPFVATSATMDFVIQARVESGGDVANVLLANIMLEHKGEA